MSTIWNGSVIKERSEVECRATTSVAEQGSSPAARTRRDSLTVPRPQMLVHSIGLSRVWTERLIERRTCVLQSDKEACARERDTRPEERREPRVRGRVHIPVLDMHTCARQTADLVYRLIREPTRPELLRSVAAAHLMTSTIFQPPFFLSPFFLSHFQIHHQPKNQQQSNASKKEKLQAGK